MHRLLLLFSLFQMCWCRQRIMSHDRLWGLVLSKSKGVVGEEIRGIIYYKSPDYPKVYTGFIIAVFTVERDQWRRLHQKCITHFEDDLRDLENRRFRKHHFEFIFTVHGNYEIDAHPTNKSNELVKDLGERECMNQAQSLKLLSRTPLLPCPATLTIKEHKCAEVQEDTGILVDDTHISKSLGDGANNVDVSKLHKIAAFVTNKCRDQESTSYNWRFERILRSNSMIHQQKSLPLCVRKGLYSKINMSAYAAHMLRLPLEFDTSLPVVYIQPNLLPIGPIRLSVEVRGLDWTVKIIGFITVYRPQKYVDLMDPTRIVMEPHLSMFYWPLEDLTFDASNSYNIYFRPESGYTKKVNPRFIWRCLGDTRCESLRKRKYINESPTLVIPKRFMKNGVFIGIHLSVEFHDEKMDLHFSAEIHKKIEFKENMPVKSLSIRCSVNCWSLVDRSRPLLLEADCKGCEEYSRRDLQMEWHISVDRSSSKIKKDNHLQFANSTYVQVVHLDSFTDNEFTVTLKMTFPERALPFVMVSQVFKLPRLVVERDTYNQVQYELETARECTKGECLINQFSRWIFESKELLLPLMDFQTTPSPIIMAIRFIDNDTEIPSGEPCDISCNGKGQDPQNDYFEHCGTCKRLFHCHGNYSALTSVDCTDPETEDHHCVELGISCPKDFSKEKKKVARSDYTLQDYIVYRSVSGFGEFAVEPTSHEGWKNHSVLLDLEFDSVLSPYTYKPDHVYVYTQNPVPWPKRENLSEVLATYQQWTIHGESLLGPISKTILEAPTDSASKAVIHHILSTYTNDTKKINYNNINLILMTALRFSKLPYIDAPLVVQLAEIIEKAFNLHKEIDEHGDAESSIEIERLLLSVINNLVSHICRLEEELTQGSTVIMDPGEAMDTLESASKSVRELLVKIIVFLPHKSIKRAPQFKVISTDTFIVKATWLSPLELSETLKIHLKDSVMWLNSTILKSLIPTTMFNPYLNVVAYASHNSLLPRKQGDLIIDKPLIMLRLEHRTSSAMEPLTKEHTKENNIFLMYPLGKLIPSYAGPNDIGTSLKMYRDMVENDSQIEKLELKVRKDPSRRIVIQSDCVLLTFEAAMDLTVTLNFLSERLFHLLVTVILEARLKDMLPIVDKKSMILPRLKPEKFNEITQSRNGIFLPALTRKNKADLRTPKYYLLIRLQPSPQASKIDDSKWTEDVDSVLYSCLRLSCFLWEDSRLTSKDCKVSEFSAGAPQYLVCNCSRGNGFTGAVNDCSNTDSRNIPMKKLEPLDASMENLAFLNWDITVVVVGLCMVFIALLFAVGFDKSDHLGKTYALPGTFSPLAEDHYLVCIVTGPGFYSSTDCSPLLILVGSKTNSRVYILDIDSKPFQANSEIWLAVSSSYPLGQLQGVILSLDNDGEKQSWFVSQVFIRQVGTDDEYLFVFDCWVREPMRNKNYGIEIVSSVEGELIHLCLRYFSRMFLIYHMIAGTIKTFPGSPFSKSQHVLYTFYSLMMLMNIVQLIEYPAHQTLQGDLESESMFRPSTEGYAESLLYGLIGALVSLPIGIIMAGMWRKSRIKVAWPNHLRFAGEKQPVVPPRAREQKIVWSVVDVDDTKTVLPKGLINLEEDMGSEVDATTNASVVSAQTSFDVRPESSRSSVSRATSSKSVSSSSTFSRKDKVEFTGDGNFKIGPSAIHGEIVNRVQLRKRWYRLTSATLLPYLVIGFLFIPVLPLSFSTCWKSLYFSKTESKGFLFHFFMSASFMYILAVPFLLFLGALFFSLMASAGKGYYGPRHEADDRMCYLRTYFPIMAFLATNFESDTRNRTVGHDQEPEIRETEKIWASKWCKWKFAVLTHTRKKYYKPRKKDQTIEAILFLIVIVVIINFQSGGILEKYLQTQYLANYLNLRRTTSCLTRVFDDVVFWNETDKILEKILQLMNPVKWEQLTELHVLGAVVLQQVRVKSYSGDCAKEYPGLIDPKCHFTLDEMPKEDRNFAGSWDKLKRGTACEFNAFTFCSVAQHARMGVSMDNMFSGGGYFALFSVQDKGRYPSISDLKDSLWVDQNTRGVLLSLTILNGGTNYVTSLKRFYSFDSNTGAIMASSQVYTFQLYYKRTAQQVLILFGMLFCALTMGFLGMQIIRLHEEGIIRYFSHHESWIVLTERIGGILGCSFTFLFLKQREVELAKIKEIYVREEEGETIISLDTLADITYWILMFTSLTGVTCFIHILVRFREFDQLRKFIDLIPKTFRLFFMPYVASVAFAFLGLLWFVNFKEFSTFSSSNVIVFVLMLKPNLIADIIQTYPYLGKIYIFFLYWIMFYVILNYFLSSILQIYSEIKMSIIQEKASKTNVSSSEGYDSAES